MLLLGEGSEAIEPYNKYDKIRPYSIRSKGSTSVLSTWKIRPIYSHPSWWVSSEHSSIVWERVVKRLALIADNCELNKAISDQTSKPLIGYAFKKFIAGELETVTKLNSLMVKVRTHKMSAKLREHTPLRPVLFTKTRWTSILFMIKRYLEIKLVW